MILSAMMFALGVFVSGLAWLAFCVALVRRTRRLTERRLLASISVSRTEFVTERDELRARHAVQMHRSEREVSRVLDMATAYRLESDVREIDLISARAELAAREEDLHDLQVRFDAERAFSLELERRNAESSSALRSAQHTLKLEADRRAGGAAAAEVTDDAVDPRLAALAIARPDAGEPRAANDREEDAASRLPRIPSARIADELRDDPAATGDRRDAAMSGSVIALPTRAKPAAENPERSAAMVADAARDLQRLAGEAHGEMAKGVWRAPAHAEGRMPMASAPGDSTVADLLAHRLAAAPANGGADAGEVDLQTPRDEKAETRFFEALAEIRALKRSASQAGE